MKAAIDLSDIPIVDHHCHPILSPNHQTRLRAAFSEAHDPVAVAQGTSTLLFQRTLLDLAGIYGCDATEASIEDARGTLGFEETARRSFEGANLQAFYVDDLIRGEAMLPASWLGRYASVKRVLRIETVAERLIGSCQNWDEFRARFTSDIGQPPEDVVALKTIVAYRTGLQVNRADERAAAGTYERLRQQVEQDKTVRLADKPLNDWLVHQALIASAESRMPLQIHTGYGDPDLDLRDANPLHLRPLLEDPAHRDARLVLLHAGYPFVREAGYLAWAYPNVSVDSGLPIPLLSVRGMRSTVEALFELAPLDTVLFSTDGHLIPERFYCAALWGRRVLGDALATAVSDGDLTFPAAMRAGEAILAGNALRLYGQRN